MGETPQTSMNIKNKIRIQRFKLAINKIGLVSLGVVIGISWYIAVNEYQNISWVSRESYVITSAQADDGHKSLEHSAKVEEGETPLSIEDKIRQAFFEEPEIAVAVAMCESRLDNSRIGDTHLPEPSYGLFQINRHFNPKYSVEELSTVEGNIKSAREIYEEGGWNRWSCYRFDYYKKYL